MPYTPNPAVLPVTRPLRRRLFRALNIFVQLTVVLSLGFQGGFGGFTPRAAFAANPSANLDQCANDPAPSPSTDGCSASASDWVNGNLGASKSVYFEGDSIPYRMLFGNLSLASHTVTIEWDTTKSDKHAIDYLTSYDRTVATANPTLGVSSPGASMTFAIPTDPQVTGAGVTPVAGNFTMWGGTITGVSGYSYADGTGFSGDKSARITLTFTATNDHPTLAWGGHISHRNDWGTENSAVAIPGSPYHTRLIDLDGSGGNQDRSLSAEAVIFPASITVVKQAAPEGSQSFAYTTTGGLSPAAFSLVDDGSATDTKLFSAITDFTTYTVTETAVPGWTLSFNDPVCTVTTANGGSQTADTDTVTIDLKEGENVSCTFNNDRQVATITVIKTVVNNDGGTAVASDFTMNVTGTNVSDPSFPGDASGTVVTVDPAVYSVTEDAVYGYASSFSTDCTGTVAAGENKTCTVTNDDVQPTLTVTKVVINNNGGTADVSDFPLFVDQTGVTSGVQNGFNAGAHVVSETGQTGYTATISGDCDAQGNVTLNPSDVKACTVTNDDEAASLTVIKHVVNDDGGTLEASDFDIHVTGGSASPADFVGNEGGTGVSLDAGAYSVTEDAVTGYAVSYSTDCTGTLAPGEHKTCTVTNNDVQPTLTVTKVVINNNGGTADVSDFPLFVDQTGVTSGVQNGFNAGAHVVSETGQTGYTATISGDCDAQGNVTLNPGDVKACTVTNDDVQPKLTVTKIVLNDDGGNAAATDFPLFVDQTAVATGVQNDFDAGTYTVSETSLTGYTQVAIGGDCNQDGTVTLNPGDEKACTVTNDDQAPTLTLVKSVTNDNGGTAGVNDFGLTVGGTPVTSGQTLPVNANTPYALNEAGLAGYGFTGFSGDAQCPQALGGTVTLNEGEDVTCVISNDDVQPTLTLYKVVVNDNGGEAVVSDFPLYISDGQVTTPTVSGAPNFLTAGVTYTASENTLFGYASGAWTGDCAPDGTVVLQPGQNASCTITNDDQVATLIVTKHMVNDNGGNNTASDFTVFVDGTNVSDPEFPGSEQGTAVTLDAGSYVVSEDEPGGYAASYLGDCQGSIGVGETKYCTIINDDVPPFVILIKEVVNDNGGTAGENDFGLTINGAAALSGEGIYVDANTPVALNESGLPGYTFVSISGDSRCPETLGGSVTLEEGDGITCVVTNDDQPARLTVVKHVVNVGGSEAVASDFTLNVDGPNASPPSFPGNESGTVVTLDAGDYVVSEDSVTGWTTIFDEGCEGTLPPGGNATCTVTNTRDSGTIHGTKFVDVNGNGAWDQGEPPYAEGVVIHLSNGWTTTTGTDGTYTFVNVPTGAYEVSEEVPAGWTPTTPSTVPVAVVKGEVSTADFGNFQNVSVTACKVQDADGSLESTSDQTPVSEWPVHLSVNGDTVDSRSTSENGCYTWTNLGPGVSYDVSEDVAAGWAALTDTTHDFGPAQSGSAYSFTFVNKFKVTELGLTKTADPTTVPAGQNVNWTVHWSVTGNTAATNVILTDPIPADTTFVSVQDGGVYNGTDTITWNLGTQNPGASGDVHFTVRTNAPLANGTVITNTATVDSAETDPAISASASVTVTSAPVLTILKTDSPDPVAAGANLTYTLQWSVGGNSPATNVVITDPIPANTTFVSADNSGTYDAGTNSITWNLGNKNLPEVGAVSFVAKVASPLPNGTVLTNTATIDSAETPPVSSTATTTVASAPVLSITKVNNVATFVNPGTVVTYTVTIANAATATDTAHNVKFTDVLPSGFTYVDGGGSTKTFTVGDLAPGASVTTSYPVNVPASQTAGLYANTATASADNYPAVSASSVVDVRVPQVLGVSAVPDLEITKTADVPFAGPDTTVTYTVTVKNVGDATAVNVILHDRLPNGFTFVSGGGRDKDWKLGDLEPGTARVINYPVRVSPKVKAGKYTNVATARADNTNQVTAKHTLPVKVAKVLGLAATGPSSLDYALFTAGALLLLFGAFGLRRKGEERA
jgi:uncharacterized repeat protein (TIGR01451 family)